MNSNRKLSFLYVFLLIPFVISCAEKKSTAPQPEKNENQKLEELSKQQAKELKDVKDKIELLGKGLFVFNEKTASCENNKGEVGFNTNTLSQCSYLTQYNAYGSNLKNFNLQGAMLPEANFDKANLDGANFAGAKLYKASFKETSLRGADFRGADLREAYFFDLASNKMDKADFSGANMQGAKIHGFHSDWKDVKLEGADMRNVDYRDPETALEFFKSKGAIVR